MAADDRPGNDSSDSSSSPKDESSSSTPTFFESVRSTIGKHMDEQRLERLKQCRLLQDALLACRRSKQSDRQQLEDFPAGIRMVRYFHWRNIHDYDEHCQRELHAVWACRGIALGCGADVIRMRNCFNEQGPATILNQSNAGYENMKETMPCADLQRTLGRCVAKEATELEQRNRNRSKQAT